MIALQGYPGSDKSNLSHSLACALQWSLIDKDDIRDALESLAPEIHATSLNGISYDAMWRVAGRQVGIGSNVIVDNRLPRLELYETACAVALQVPQQCISMMFTI